jgi:HAD superfamily hydrolase (TIGR01490 family)
MSDETIRDLMARNLGWTVRGWTPQRARQAFEWIAEHYVMPRVRADVLARVREHQSAGHRVILVSGTLSPLLAAIGRELGIEETVGTPLIVRNGRYTGVADLPVCQGAGKVVRVEAHLRGDPTIRWDASFAYADSHTDLPLLERAGHPVAVYPDVPLAEQARQRRWEILGKITPVENRRA